MGFWTRLDLRQLLRSTQGSLTAEAAIGIGAVLFVAVALLQAIGVVLVYIQLQVTGYEAFRILSASGDYEIRKSQALDFLENADSRIQFSIQRNTNEVELTLSKPTASSIGFLPDQVEVSIQGLLLDAAVW